jgi:asparagine synthase (glutamine-hydrolysing)
VVDALDLPWEPIAVDDYSFFWGFGDGDGEPGLRTPEPVDNLLIGLRRVLTARMATHARVAVDGEDGDSLMFMPAIHTQFRTLPAGEVVLSWIKFFLDRHTLPSTGLRVRERLGIVKPLTPPFPAWMQPQAVERFGLTERWKRYWEPSLDPASPRPLTKKRLTAGVWQPFLEMNESGTSGIPLEFRFPLLDVRVLDFVLAIPPLPWCYRKEILRASMRDVLPQPVLARPKTVPPGLFESRLQELRDRPRYFGAVDPLIHEFVRPDFFRPDRSGEAAEVAVTRLRPYLLNYWLRASC